MLKIYTAHTQELKNDALFWKQYQTVPAHRKEKIDRMRFDKDKRLSLGAWLLLTEGLSEIGIHDKEMDLSYGTGGKPFLKKYPDIYFSLSHSEEAVMCAISDREVGCDVEKVKDIDLKIAKRFFHEKEYEKIIGQSTKEERLDMFYRFWTLKESFMKVTGLGMRLALSDFMIELGHDTIRVEQQVQEKAGFYFKEFDLKDGYQYACCVQTEGE